MRGLDDIRAAEAIGADLLYHASVLMESAEIAVGEIEAELLGRHR